MIDINDWPGHPDAIDRMIEAVESGSATTDLFSVVNMRGAWQAYGYKSLDTALLLKEVLLPGWIWGRQQNGAMWVASGPHTIRAPASMEPARALLLVVLKAYRETRG